MQLSVASRAYVHLSSSFDKIISDEPAKIFKELTPGYTVVMNMNQVVDLIVHVRAVGGRDAIAAGLAGRDIFIITGVIKPLMLAIKIYSKVGVIMYTVRRFVGSKTNSKNQKHAD